MTPPVFTEHFSTLAGEYDLLLSDVWGVIHNGLTAFPPACDALSRFRAGGGSVVLITNSPRPSDSVRQQLDEMGVPRTSYDGMVSSGDVTRLVMAGRAGQSVFHLGPARDRVTFEGLNVRFADERSADYVVCSGLFNDEVEGPEDYRDMLTALRARGLFMLCANPDVVVERGARLIYCAGALADVYAEMGGEVLYAGKPYAPIYESALAKAPDEQRKRVLAIGDSVRTDMAGARTVGLDFIFLTAGIHAEELGDSPDAETLRAIFNLTGPAPKAIMKQLVW